MSTEHHIPDYVFALHTFATRDISRAHLAYIRLENGHAIATDGHRMTIVEVPGLDCEVSLPRELCVNVMKGWKASDRGTGAILTVDGKRLTVTRAGATFTAESEDAVYPNWRNVMPSRARTAGDGPVGFNPTYVGDISKYLKDCKVENPVVAMYPQPDALSQMLFVYDGPRFKADFVVMPCRL